MFWKKKAAVSDAATGEVEKESDSKVCEELLEIDRALGMSYCMNMEDFYLEMCGEFCSQATEYLPKLEAHYQAEDWEHYAIVAHALKGNSLNIGAAVFSKYSLQHELAGKEGNVEFIKAEYEKYVKTLKALIEKLEGMGQRS